MPEWVGDMASVVTRLEATLLEVEARGGVPAPVTEAPRPPAPAATAEPKTVTTAAVAAPTGPAAALVGGPVALPGEEPFGEWALRTAGPRSRQDALPETKAATAVRAVAVEVTKAEDPIHEVRLARAVASAFGLTRLNEARIRPILDVVPATARGVGEPRFF